MILVALFVEFPEDAGAWLIEDEYLFGSDILVAPLLLDNATSRDVYLPKGKWIDYQTNKVYEKGWSHLDAGALPIVMLIRDGAVIPSIKLAQSTMQMDWKNIQLNVYSVNSHNVSGLICLPNENILQSLSLSKKGGSFRLDKDPMAGKVKFKVITK